MGTKLITATKFSQREKMMRIKLKFRPFGWSDQEYLLEPEKIGAEFLVSFSNGKTWDC